MSLEWVVWSNPVAIWWAFLIAVAAANIALWFALRRSLRRALDHVQFDRRHAELMLWLCAAYVFGCAFRSILPRADVQRIALFDTWISSVLVGRSVATVAEVCFVIQWAIVLRYLGGIVNSDTVRNVSRLIVPLILIAETCSWYAVITLNYLGNTVENSLWAVSFALIAVALLRLLVEFRGVARLAIGISLAGVAGYLVFLTFIDVPMYFARWQAQDASGVSPLDLFAGLHDVATRWVVTHDAHQWRDEMTWMALYFSAGVWSSLALCGFGLIRHRVPRYHSRSRARSRGLIQRVRTVTN